MENAIRIDIGSEESVRAGFGANTDFWTARGLSSLDQYLACMRNTFDELPWPMRNSLDNDEPRRAVDVSFAVDRDEMTNRLTGGYRVQIDARGYSRRPAPTTVHLYAINLSPIDIAKESTIDASLFSAFSFAADRQYPACRFVYAAFDTKDANAAQDEVMRYIKAIFGSTEKANVALVADSSDGTVGEWDYVGCENNMSGSLSVCYDPSTFSPLICHDAAAIPGASDYVIPAITTAFFASVASARCTGLLHQLVPFALPAIPGADSAPDRANRVDFRAGVCGDVARRHNVYIDSIACDAALVNRTFAKHGVSILRLTASFAIRPRTRWSTDSLPIDALFQYAVRCKEPQASVSLTDLSRVSDVVRRLANTPGASWAKDVVIRADRMHFSVQKND
jgi:hypothetical protein